MRLVFILGPLIFSTLAFSVEAEKATEADDGLHIHFHLNDEEAKEPAEPTKPTEPTEPSEPVKPTGTAEPPMPITLKAKAPVDYGLASAHGPFGGIRKIPKYQKYPRRPYGGVPYGQQPN